ncbi:MAG: M1 family metallopeptidase [Urechidicola sp.]|nr:M1 family metallopeptidase [Urechidicola sp.]
MKNTFLFSILSLLFFVGNAQSNSTYWQQHVDYTMDIDMNVENYQYDGKQKLVYTNNSPDDLEMVFYHLYFNAFQSDSEMYVYSQNIPDPDRRFIEKLTNIPNLDETQIGFIKVNSLKQNGKPVKYEVTGTVLKVYLNTPIKAGKKATFEMEYLAQVPEQTRRSGRNNKEGVALSMAQWYPKMAEYDVEGWHADPYISHEFHGVWGGFDVTIHIDKNYTIGGTGYLQNPQKVGHGYEDTSKKMKLPKGDKLTWNFIAPNVHDFTWAADPNYTHDILEGPNGVELHFLYKDNLVNKNDWIKMEEMTVKTMEFYNELVGDYPYKQYSVIQGGDGGMEYGMSTLITANRRLSSLIGVMQHELGHSWFQFVLATNESKHAWMDEGFTTYIDNLATNELVRTKKLDNPFIYSYMSYFKYVANGMQESLSVHIDRYKHERVASSNAYQKGAIFLVQLGYIIGQDNLDKTLKKYYQEFKFKHPTPNDIMRTAEKVSGIQLDWYLNEWTQTTHTIDYGIKVISNKSITLERVGRIPMPIDVFVTYTDGTSEEFYIPLRMMQGSKPTNATQLNNWAWAFPTYTFNATKEIKSVEIDPSKRMADIDRKNNLVEISEQ